MNLVETSQTPDFVKIVPPASQTLVRGRLRRRKLPVNVLSRIHKIHPTFGSQTLGLYRTEELFVGQYDGT